MNAEAHTPSTAPIHRHGLHAELERRFLVWLDHNAFQPGGVEVPFQHLHQDFQRFVGDALKVTPQYLGGLLAARFYRRSTRVKGRTGDVLYLLNRAVNK